MAAAVAVLFARADSVYKTMPGLDVFDIERDARTFAGGAPVVAHPPCRAWGRLRTFAKPRDDERECGSWAVDMVRQCGGVLEHPAQSSLWLYKCMPPPCLVCGICSAVGPCQSCKASGAIGPRKRPGFTSSAVARAMCRSCPCPLPASHTRFRRAPGCARACRGGGLTCRRQSGKRHRRPWRPGWWKLRSSAGWRRDRPRRLHRPGPG
jgi:hypothetical protein